MCIYAYKLYIIYLFKHNTEEQINNSFFPTSNVPFLSLSCNSAIVLYLTIVLYLGAPRKISNI